MNIFVVPSWYPSLSNPYSGIFFREQSHLLAMHFPTLGIGVSHWGQNDERLLLWSKDHMKNLLKITQALFINRSQTQIEENCIDFFSPAFTWSQKLLSGNMRKIVQANVENFNNFRKLFGKVDIIHAHVGFPGGFIAYSLKMRFNIPYIITEHMSPFPFDDYQDSSGKWIEPLSIAYSNASKIIAVSTGLKSKIVNANYPNVEVMYNYLNDSEFTPQMNFERPPGWPLKILFVGRLDHQKGLDILIESCPQLLNELQEFSVEIVGTGPQEKPLKMLALKRNMAKNFLWSGFQTKERVIKSIQRCDIFVLPSRHENMPLALLEALACGKPCVVTRCGGPEEIVSNEVGRVVEKENPKALAEALIDVARNLHQYPAAKVRAYFEKHFSAKMATSRLVKVYEEVINAEKGI